MANNFLKLNNGNFLKITASAVNNFLTSEPNYLCFTAEEANSTVELCKHGAPSIANTAYSRDKITWTTFTPVDYYSAGTNVITLTNIGDKVYFRNNITDNFTALWYLQFIMTGKIAASGNINSMYSSTAFSTLTTLSYAHCYANMFDGCSSLTQAPQLPATTLTNYCYGSMFRSCTSLTQAPNLPATTLASYCYTSMFNSCTSLTTAPALPVITLANHCYRYMFNGCTSLTTTPALPATTLYTQCYEYMFQGCTSLTTAPELPATILAGSCSYGMFSGCTSLQVSDTQTAEAPYAWHIPTTGTFTNTTTYDQLMMFSNCLGTRSSDWMSGAQGESHTYYTQNQPV